MGIIKGQHRIYIFVTVAIMLTGAIYLLCRGANRVVIEGHIATCDDMMVYLERYNGDQQRVIDSAKLNNAGMFRFVVDNGSEESIFYDLVFGWERIPLLCKSGDKIKVDAAGSVSLNYRVSGSEESELLRSFFQPYIKGTRELKSILSRYSTEQRAGKDLSESIKAYNNKYKEIKQSQLRFIVENKGKLAAIYALTQHISGDDYLIDEQSDMVYMNMISEEVALNYPNSPYLNTLKHKIELIESRQELLSSVNYLDYPEITLNDIYGKSISLSSLKGNVILLDFWAPQIAESNRNNAELKEIYVDFGKDGLEIYQVGVEKNKSQWINAIQEQRLPWISVSDLLGESSPTLGLYNVTKLPSNVLIGRDGDIIAINIFGEQLRESVAALVAKR